MYMYIYIYIYVCVCVCVSVCLWKFKNMKKYSEVVFIHVWLYDTFNVSFFVKPSQDDVSVRYHKQ